MSITLVQSASTNTGNPSVTRTLNGVAAGNLLVACFMTPNAGGFTNFTFSDNNGNTWVVAEELYTNINGNTMGIAYAQNVNGGNTTLTMTSRISVQVQCNLAEFNSGIPGAALALDTGASATGTGTSLSSGNATTANNVELLIGCLNNLNGSLSTGSGYTSLSTSVNDQISEYQVTSSSGAYAATGSGTTGTWGAALATFLILPLPIFNTIAGRFNSAGTLVGNLLVPIWSSSNVTPVTVSTNTTSDQDLMSAVIPANTMNSVGRTLRGVIKGVYSTPMSSTATLEIKVQLGSLTLLDITTDANAGSVTNNGFRFDFDITTQTAGSSAKFETSGELSIDLGAATTTAANVYVDSNHAVSSTLDVTANQTLQITVAFSAGSTSNSCTQRQLILNTIN